ncbi:MAG: ArsB/NhaD family transporter, partial [Thermoanaerobaculia bacterium]
IVVSYMGLKIFFGRSIPLRFELPADMRTASRPGGLQLWCGAVLIVTLIGFFSEGWSGIPTWLVAAAGAATLLAVHSTMTRSGVQPIFRRVGWDVVLFLCGMFVVGMGLRSVGFTHMLGQAISGLSEGDPSRMRLATGLLAGVSSAVMNNHPIAGMMAWVIQDFSLPLQQQKLMAFAALIGGDLGPKMLPVGSLAALMWFRLLRDRGVEIPYSLYVKIGVPVTLAAILASVLTLNLEAWLLAAR